MCIDLEKITESIARQTNIPLNIWTGTTAGVPYWAQYQFHQLDVFNHCVNFEAKILGIIFFPSTLADCSHVCRPI